jgi:hypothetical protein
VALAVAAAVTAGDEAVVVPAVELLFELPELAIAPPIPTRSNAPTTIPTLRTRWPFFFSGIQAVPLHWYLPSGETGLV